MSGWNRWGSIHRRMVDAARADGVVNVLCSQVMLVNVMKLCKAKACACMPEQKERQMPSRNTE